MATLSSIITFVPTIGDNHKKPEVEQFAFKLKAVNMAKKQDQLRRFIKMDPKKLLEEMMDERRQGEIKQLLEEHFVRSVNFTVTREATEEDIKAEKKGLVKGELVTLTLGQEYESPITIADIFELGEFELAMEIFMFMIGNSQLRKMPDPKKTDAQLTVAEEREDEEKNSESPSGSTLTSVQ